MPRLLGMALALCACLLSLRARAQDPADLPPGATVGDSLTAGVEQDRPFWKGSGPQRPFFASVIDVGAVYLRSRGQLGFGKPHYRWLGVEIVSGLSLGALRGYAGLRGVWPRVIDLRIGARFEHPTDQPLLPKQDAYVREELESQRFGNGVYLTGEAELTAAPRVPGGSIVAVLTGMFVTNVPDNRFLFERALRVVHDPPWLWRARLGYLYHVGWQGTLRMGAAAEVIHLVERNDAVVRAGPALSVALTHHLEANAAVMIVAHSPDQLGITGADLGQLGLRYRWATGDRWAAFP